LEIKADQGELAARFQRLACRKKDKLPV